MMSEVITGFTEPDKIKGAGNDTLNGFEVRRI